MVVVDCGMGYGVVFLRVASGRSCPCGLCVCPCVSCLSGAAVENVNDIVTSTCSALIQFFTRADAARNRRADEAGPALLRVLRDLWRDTSPEVLRDLEDGCERLLFPTPDAVVAKSSRGPRDRSGYGRGSRDGGNDGRRNGVYYHPRDDGYGSGSGRNGYDTYEHARAPGFAPPPQRPAAAPSTDHMDRCVHCNGEHLSQRCYTKFPNLRPAR
jgi:hypothetical protein